MRVAWLMTDYPKNSQTFNHEEICGIERHGAEVLPIALNSPDAHDLQLSEHRLARERTLYLREIPLWRGISAMIRFVVKHPVAAFLALRLAMRTSGADLVVIAKRMNHLVGALLVLNHCRRSGVHHIHAQFGGAASTIAMLAASVGCWVDGERRWTWSYTVHGLDIWNDPPWLARVKVASADVVICVADYTRAQMLRVCDISDWWRVRVARCGIDLERFPKRASRLQGVPFRLITAGRLAPEKGLTVLLEALPLLEKRGVDVALSIIGSGPEENLIREFIETRGLTTKVSLIGEQPAHRIPGLLAEADAFCLASFMEGVPIAIIEAMATGVPVVCSQAGGIPEVVENGVTGICVPPGRSDLLAEGIAAVATDAGLRLSLSSCARQRVEEMYDGRKTSLQLLEAIEEAARNRVTERVDGFEPRGRFERPEL